MRMQRLKRAGAEQVFGTFKNGEARLLIPGEPVCIDWATDKDGATIIAPAAVSVSFPAGVTVKTIGTSGNHDEYGEILVYGYAAVLRIMTATTINAGDPLGMAAGTSCFVPVKFGATTIGTEAEIQALARAIAIAGTTIGTSTVAQSIVGFVKAL